MKPHSFHREAREEYAEAARHYAGISPALGQRFFRVIDGLIADACRTPNTFRLTRQFVVTLPGNSPTESSTLTGPMTSGFSP